MRIYLDDSNNLHLLLSTETPDELVGLTSLQEVVEVLLPKLRDVSPEELQAKTDAPVFQFEGRYWYYASHLELDPIEELRDNGKLTLHPL